MTAAGPATELTAVAPFMLARWRLSLQDAPMTSSSAGARQFARTMLWLLSLLALAALLWTGAWFYAARFATGKIAAWMEREKGHGRVWSCPEQTIGGFPFAMDVSCKAPALLASNAGKTIAGALGGLTAKLSVFRPDRIAVTLASPLAVTDRTAGQTFNLQWNGLEGEIRGLPSSVAAVDIAIRQPAAAFAAAGATPQTVRAEFVQLKAVRASGRPETDRAYDVALQVKAAGVPALDALVRSAEALDLDAAFVATQAGLASDPDMLSRLEIWRRAGGRLELASVSLVKGPLSLQSKGTLALDVAHRPEGELEVEAAGIEDLAAQFGVPPGSLKLGGLLAGLTGSPPPAANPKALHLSLKMRDGRLYLGPFKTPVKLAPLY